MWSSPYIHLTSTETTHGIEDVIDLIECTASLNGISRAYVE